MIGNLHNQEEEIQQRWREYAAKLGDADDLCTDGLLFRGKPYFQDGCWHRDKADEESVWGKAPRRLLILTKDLNDEEGWDIRQETGRYNTVVYNYERAIPFYKNLRMWSYLLLNGSPDELPLYSQARLMDIVGPYYEEAPIARVNCKKQVGGASISDSTLMSYMETYSDLLKRQIAIYDANLLLCCGCNSDTNLILDFVKSQYLPDLQPVPDTGDWMYYSPSTRKIAVNCYHPSARIGYEDTYSKLAEVYGKCLEYISQHYHTKF